MDGFSGTLRLSDLNDFMAPAQECIKPVTISRIPEKGKSIKISASGDYSEVDAKGQEKILEKAAISLSDCLACSGCVTSAETILIQQQSVDELQKVIRENLQVPADRRRLIVVSVSQQSIASLARRYRLTMRECQDKVCWYLRSLGVDRVYDLSAASALALTESQREFVNRARRNDPGSLPMLASACPGWICYAEKTHGSWILPYISTTKSPQQIQGSLIKTYMSRIEKQSPDRYYHATLMMCYDKKLEASREDFYDDVLKTRDVDCVITSLEMEQMLEKNGVLLEHAYSSALDYLPGISAEFHHSGSGAGGYLENILRYASKELFQHDIGSVEYKTIRNQDFKETTVTIDGELKLYFAAAYGFRNIQNIVQKLKRSKCPYGFVEIMACPSACLNGGGQIRVPSSGEAKVWLHDVQELFDSLEKSDPHFDVPWLEDLYQELREDSSTEPSKLLHTQYHSLENKTNVLNIKW